MPSDLGDQLVAAAVEGDTAELKRLLKSKTIDVDYVGESPPTASTTLVGRLPRRVDSTSEFELQLLKRDLGLRVERSCRTGPRGLPRQLLHCDLL